MKILVLGINYFPEMVGIGPYTAGMARWLAAAGHQVTMVCAKPYYPEWKVNPAYAGGGERISSEHGVRVIRLPIYIPSKPDGKRRVLHHISFAARAQVAMMREVRRDCPDIVIGIAPSIISMVAARNAARQAEAKLWLHVQDFEVEAAIATGLLSGRGMFATAARGFESWAIKADRVSTISPQMCERLVQKGVEPSKVVEFRNWADINKVMPLEFPSTYRTEWSITQPHVAVYSGNIANKQGIEIIVKAASLLRHRKDLLFLVCGNGPNRARLRESAAGLDNIMFQDLQPGERLSELLGLASVHLLPQIENAADLVLPSKLTNMLASGKPVIATAVPGTGLAREVEGCGLITTPGNAEAFASAIIRIVDDSALRESASRNARQRAVARWTKEKILSNFESELQKLAVEA